VVAFELLFRGCAAGAREGIDDLQASSHVILRAVSDLGLAHSLGRFTGYLNADRALLTSDLVEVLPPERFVLEILERTPVDAHLRERLVALRAAGYRLALDDVIDADDPRLELLPLVDVVKVDVLASPAANWCALAARLGGEGRRLLAEKVETPEQFAQARAAGYTLFQGYFLSRPQLLRARRMPASVPQVLRLVSLLEQDPDIAIVARTLRGLPELLRPLLREVNASAAGLGRRIDSIPGAVALVGLRQISRWAQLLVYAEHDASPPGTDPLLLQVGTRARMMELLAGDWFPDRPHLPERAFLTGMLSKLDALVGAPLAEVTAGLPLTDEVGAALAHRDGPLGDLLAVCEARERLDEPALRRLCWRHRGDTGGVARRECEAAGWALRHAPARRARRVRAAAGVPGRAGVRGVVKHTGPGHGEPGGGAALFRALGSRRARRAGFPHHRAFPSAISKEASRCVQSSARRSDRSKTSSTSRAGRTRCRARVRWWST
jgi:EAL and modified HD-GYP domain-containing signal transduction protein